MEGSHLSSSTPGSLHSCPCLSSAYPQSHKTPESVYYILIRMRSALYAQPLVVTPRSTVGLLSSDRAKAAGRGQRTTPHARSLWYRTAANASTILISSAAVIFMLQQVFLLSSMSHRGHIPTASRQRLLSISSTWDSPLGLAWTAPTESSSSPITAHDAPPRRLLGSLTQLWQPRSNTQAAAPPKQARRARPEELGAPATYPERLVERQV